MKKNGMKKIAVVLACLLVSAFVLVGCGGDKYADSPYLGKWTATSASMSGISVSPSDVLGGDMIFELEASGKCTLTIAEEENSGSWEPTDNGFSVEGEFEFVVDGDEATMEYQGLTFIFER